MKILKLLSKFFIILLLSSTFAKTTFSNDPVDIWNIEKKENTIEEKLIDNNKNITNQKNKIIKNSLNCFKIFITYDFFNFFIWSRKVNFRNQYYSYKKNKNY